ncbi:MAG: anti-sigma factor RsiW [Candidatus Latescibacterota bacterium]|jgi:anti-sigma factor RsiW
MDDHLDYDGELLSAYLDEALDLKRTAEVEALLAESAEARNHLQELVRLQQAFRQWEPVKPDVFFLRRVETLIAGDTQTSHLVQSWSGRISKFAVAAMILLTLGGMAFLTHLRQDPLHTDVEAFLHGFLDQDVAQVVALTESDVSNDAVLDLILTDNVR